ncbi:mediator of RNA polymerase II transcription subunit 15a-like [Lolium rigidum]|uniref:mediator of RNA polymerase II transcription subunit 15a-like n=1 Tax=Lolium rigidum TaxID=89674 RepID=UPI001F5C7DA4|nr:mediator of RNA polymerase II transcription subunit 15a-like [Lolium rigidum]
MHAEWRPMQGSDPAAGGDWRAQLQPEERSRAVHKMMETLQKCLPVSVPERLNEFLEIAVQFEENIYTAATNHSDYLRKISRKLLTMAPVNAQVISNQNNPVQAYADSTAQTGHAGGGNWQEEIYQMIKRLKGQYFVELNELFNKVSVKLQQIDSLIPPQEPSEQYELLKRFKIMLDRILQVLQISKSAIQPSIRHKVPQCEEQIIRILTSRRRKLVQPQAPQRFQPPAGQASNFNISHQQHPSQSLSQHDSHTNLQASLSSTAQQNGSNVERQAGYAVEAAQGSNFSSWQSGSMGGTLRQGSAGLMQGTMNVQLQTGSSSMLSHLSGQREHMTKRKWRDTL